MDFDDSMCQWSSVQAQSTPKKPRPSNCDTSINDGSFMSINVSAFSLDLTADDDQPKRTVSKKENKFAVPKKAKSKRKHKLICDICSKGYVCTASYRKHVINHKVQEAASRLPDTEGIMKNVHNISKKALQAIQEAPSSGTSGVRFQQLITKLLAMVDSAEWKNFGSSVCSRLLNSVADIRFLLPSQLVSGLVGQADSLLSDVDLCRSIFNILGIQEFKKDDALHQFMLEFVLAMCLQIVAFISQTLGSTGVNLNVQGVTEEDKEVIFYIAGSVMRGFVRLAYRYKSSEKWSKILRAIKSQILTTNCDSENAAWTKSVDRGALLYINKGSEEFFIQLTSIVLKCEQRNGSIDYGEVLNKVSVSNLPVMWDSLIFDRLDHVMSLNLMNEVVKNLARVCACGFAKRRLNCLRKGPVISMPTKHLVASRKKK